MMVLLMLPFAALAEGTSDRQLPPENMKITQEAYDIAAKEAKYWMGYDIPGIEEVVPIGWFTEDKPEEMLYTGLEWKTSWKIEGTDTWIHLLFDFKEDGQLHSIRRALIGPETLGAEAPTAAPATTLAERIAAVSDELAEAFGRDEERFQSEIDMLDYYEKIMLDDADIPDVVALLYRHNAEGLPNALIRYIWDPHNSRMNAIGFYYPVP